MKDLIYVSGYKEDLQVRVPLRGTGMGLLKPSEPYKGKPFFLLILLTFLPSVFLYFLTRVEKL